MKRVGNDRNKRSKKRQERAIGEPHHHHERPEHVNHPFEQLEDHCPAVSAVLGKLVEVFDRVFLMRHQIEQIMAYQCRRKRHPGITGNHSDCPSGKNVCGKYHSYSVVSMISPAAMVAPCVTKPTQTGTSSASNGCILICTVRCNDRMRKPNVVACPPACPAGRR